MLFKNKAELLKKVILWTTYALIIVETYLILLFGTRFSTLMLTLVMETTVNEVKGFFTTYIWTQFCLEYLLGVLALTFMLVCVNFSVLRRKCVEILDRVLCSKIIEPLLLTVVVLSLSLGAFRTVRTIYWHTYSLDEIGRVRKYAFYSTDYIAFSTLYNSIRDFWLGTRDLPTLITSLQNATYDSCDYLSDNIIIVIGESFNKHHSNLYGYPLNTNPYLSEERNLYIMTDVITSDRSTSFVIKNIFSFRSKDNDLNWAETPLFPAIFKKAGYYCKLVSNQSVEGENGASVFDLANDYLTNCNTRTFMWDETNTNLCTYDMQLIDEYMGLKKDRPHNLTVFHLLGQHTAYQDRYPSDKAYFTDQHYDFRDDLSTVQKRNVAHYDNALRYGDEVIKSIIDQFRDQDAIVIFFSDHGEEIYDYRDYMGRSHEPQITENIAKYVFEVPFFIWMSDTYKESHPQILDKVERALERPYVLDNLPHLLLDLAGIKCEMFEPDKSLISDEYVSPRRLIHTSLQDYDELMN